MERISTSSQRSNERSPLLSAQAGLPNEHPIPSRSLIPTYVPSTFASPSRKSSFTTSLRRPSIDIDVQPESVRLLDDASPTTPGTRHGNHDTERNDEVSQIPFPTTPDPKKQRSFIKRNKGIILLGLAQFFFSTMNFFYKLINLLPAEESPPVTALEVILIRMSITWIGCVGFMVATGVEYPFLGPPSVRKLLVLRGFVGFFGLFGLYYSLEFLSLADATVITFLGPLATGALGYLVLSEPFTLRETVGGIVSLGGVVLIARPAFIFGRKAADAEEDAPFLLAANATNTTLQVATTMVKHVLEHGTELVNSTLSTTPHSVVTTSHVTEKQRLFAVALALLGVCGGAAAYITIRAIGHRASATHSVAYFSLYSTIVSALLMWLTGTRLVLPSQPKWIVLLICVGIFGLAAQILLAMGLQREKAGRAVSVTYLQIVYASLYQLVFLHTAIQPLSAVGMVIILVAAGWIAAAKS